MKAVWILVSTAISLTAADAPRAKVYHATKFEESAPDPARGWRAWSPRSEIAPRIYIESNSNRGEPGALAISGNSNPAAYGGWEHVLPAEAGRWYQLTAHYKAIAVPHERHQVLARLDWQNQDGKRAGQPDYAYQLSRDGDWNRVTLEVQAPPETRHAKLQLLLGNAPQGTLYWDDISFEEISAPAIRTVAISAIRHRPRQLASAEENVRSFIKVAEETITGKTDIILLPEGITIVGNGKKYADVAESIPGPTTRLLAELSKKHNAYVVAGIFEREGPVIYNTAVLLDRQGNVTGKYRKVYLPREEMEGGLTPGSDYPVFQTDFGKVGMMICWDVQYTDPARALALRGAELILMPIWGGSELLGRARALENHVFLATSGYDYPASIVDPQGEVLALTSKERSAAVQTVDLSRRYREKWLGEMRGRFMKELRLDVPADGR